MFRIVVILILLGGVIPLIGQKLVNYIRIVGWGDRYLHNSSRIDISRPAFRCLVARGWGVL